MCKSQTGPLSPALILRAKSSTETKHGAGVNVALQKQLEELQERNRLLKELCVLRAAEVKNKSSVTSPTTQQVVKKALLQARETGDVNSVNLERIVHLAKRPSPNRSTRRPLATTNANQGSSQQLKLKLKLSEIASLADQCQTAREPTTRLQDMRTPEPSAPATARESSHRSTESERLVHETLGSGAASRYQTLLTALKLDKQAPRTSGTDFADATHVGQRTLEDPANLESSQQGQMRQTGRPRCHSAPADLLAWTRTKLKSDEGVGGQAGRWSLPGSPRWTDDMNPSHQPDGEFSREKKVVFERGVQTLLRKVRFGGTVLETKVEAKRSKHSSQLWGHQRNQAKAGCNRGAWNPMGAQCGRSRQTRTTRRC